jgi:hypothetical protein
MPRFDKVQRVRGRFAYAGYSHQGAKILCRILSSADYPRQNTSMTPHLMIWALHDHAALSVIFWKGEWGMILVLGRDGFRDGDMQTILRDENREQWWRSEDTVHMDTQRGLHISLYYLIASFPSSRLL